ncbi:hypothetical protein, partial [Croceicoccus sp. BE223]|uniref:hypothetical protein n=1 Tax=Croceicoccus sp. BE223 TaxID=2817716 RepID=UPI00286A1715
DVTLTNTGSIEVSATTDMGESSAYGIVVTDAGGAVAATEEPIYFTLNNDGGSIVAMTSVDGGATFQHGVAIDTSDSPNTAMLNFTGDSYVYGDIITGSDDMITVADGELTFDGTINSAPEVIDDVQGPFSGSLTIADGGTLYLVDEPTDNDMYDGPAMVYVNDLTIDAGGTLALQLPSGSVEEGDYPQIFANTADITGSSLVVRPSSENGLYADTYDFQDIIDANELTGTFASVTSDNLFFTPTATYDAFENVDLALNRIAFDAIPGLTVNQTNTGAGIENVYSPALTGPFGDLVSELFTLDADEYADALDQLDGDMYAGFMQGLRNNALQMNAIVSDQIDCAISIDGVDKCGERDGETRL